jgi:Flp pilus assembly protein TadD
VISSLASLYSRLGRRTIVLAAAGLVALVLGFLLWPQQKLIDAGKQSESAGLQDAIPKAIGARQWPQAGANITKFEQLAPGDPRVAEWRKQVLDGSLDDLRSSIQNAIREKDWAKAEAQIASLLAKAPDDPEATEWRALVAQGRKTDRHVYTFVPAKKDSKREAQHQTELAQADQLLQQGNYAGAIALFQRVLTEDRSDARARSGLKQATDAKAAEDRVFGGGR